MGNQKLQTEKIQPSNKISNFRMWMIIYLDIVIRGLISFFGIGVVLSIFLIGFLHISWIFVLPLSFFCSIIVSPFLSKIKLAEKVIDYYDGLLQKLIK